MREWSAAIDVCTIDPQIEESEAGVSCSTGLTSRISSHPMMGTMRALCALEQGAPRRSASQLRGEGGRLSENRTGWLMRRALGNPMRRRGPRTIWTTTPRKQGPRRDLGKFCVLRAAKTGYRLSLHSRSPCNMAPDGPISGASWVTACRLRHHRPPNRPPPLPWGLQGELPSEFVAIDHYELLRCVSPVSITKPTSGNVLVWVCACRPTRADTRGTAMSPPASRRRWRRTGGASPLSQGGRQVGVVPRRAKCIPPAPSRAKRGHAKGRGPPLPGKRGRPGTAPTSTWAAHSQAGQDTPPLRVMDKAGEVPAARQWRHEHRRLGHKGHEHECGQHRHGGRCSVEVMPQDGSTERAQESQTDGVLAMCRIEKKNMRIGLGCGARSWRVVSRLVRA